MRRYRENMRRRAAHFTDRQSNPLETAVYWVEYVLRHRDTSHLKPYSVRMSWFTYYSLDIIFVALFLLYLVFYLITGVWKLLKRALGGDLIVHAVKLPDEKKIN